MKHADSLSEVTDFAREIGGAQVYISESESNPAGMSLGDEDSVAGSALKMKVQVLVKAAGNCLFFQEEYEDEKLYKLAVSQLDELKESVPCEMLGLDEMDEKLN
ncbi:hypothetical protein J7I93_15845 [Bacillus sp. ISL-47]|uniref:hypothetical protein n=1 Tax=Bacillus sp. ISL-47 TaxID=2819130 RepID=UPI001BECD704|nr:hypothetical protein [Bacillus sp. ISL-47]MBT2689662.1 hypothetical protein [Bacillus sp. ISL-47]MBT2709308.1 hypothetical protein [Pseudomonas sp. ISL-84]